MTLHACDWYLILAGGSGEIDNAVNLEKIADMTEKYENQYSDSFFPAYQTRWPGVMLRFFGEISASEWMKKDRTLDAEKVKDFFQQVNRIYQAGQKAGNASLDSTYEYAEKMERIYDKNRREESSSIHIWCLVQTGRRFSPMAICFLWKNCSY